MAKNIQIVVVTQSYYYKFITIGFIITKEGNSKAYVDYMIQLWGCSSISNIDLRQRTPLERPGGWAIC